MADLSTRPLTEARKRALAAIEAEFDTKMAVIRVWRKWRLDSGANVMDVYPEVAARVLSLGKWRLAQLTAPTGRTSAQTQNVQAEGAGDVRTDDVRTGASVAGKQ